MSLEENRKIVDERYNQIKENLELSNNNPVFMSTSYIETKIQDRLRIKQSGGYNSDKLDDELLFLESALTDLLSKAMEAVGEKEIIDRSDRGSTRENIIALESIRYKEGSNRRREQTLTNLSKLQSNK